MNNETQQIASSEQSANYSDSDAELFMNLAPTNQKKSQNSNNQQHSILAKMRRLVGDAYLKKATDINSRSSKTQKGKMPKTIIAQAFNPESDSFASDNEDKSQNMERQRSRDNKQNKRICKNVEESPQNKINSATILPIQKQNLKSEVNKSSTQSRTEQKDRQNVIKKFNKFAQIEKQLLIPIHELPIIQRNFEEEKQEKNAKKRLDRMMEKKYKQYKVGKVKDQASNCVFNGIEDYFM